MSRDCAPYLFVFRGWSVFLAGAHGAPSYAALTFRATALRGLLNDFTGDCGPGGGRFVGGEGFLVGWGFLNGLRVLEFFGDFGGKAFGGVLGCF